MSTPPVRVPDRITFNARPRRRGAGGDPAGNGPVPRPPVVVTSAARGPRAITPAPSRRWPGPGHPGPMVSSGVATPRGLTCGRRSAPTPGPGIAAFTRSRHDNGPHGSTPAGCSPGIRRGICPARVGANPLRRPPASGVIGGSRRPSSGLPCPPGAPVDISWMRRANRTSDGLDRMSGPDGRQSGNRSEALVIGVVHTSNGARSQAGTRAGISIAATTLVRSRASGSRRVSAAQAWLTDGEVGAGDSLSGIHETAWLTTAAPARFRFDLPTPDERMATSGFASGIVAMRTLGTGPPPTPRDSRCSSRCRPSGRGDRGPWAIPPQTYSIIQGYSIDVCPAYSVALCLLFHHV